MAFVNELFERLSKSTSASDVQSALASLNTVQDPIQRNKAAEETLQLIQTYAQELLGSSQYKKAAYQFFSGSQVIKNFINKSELENQWLKSSAEALAKASEEHISWEDMLGGAACMTISSLLRIITGDWNINNHLDDFIKRYDFSANQAATACLYIPYYLAGAISSTNPNPSLLQQAADYSEQYLINTKPASMFVDGIKRAIENTRRFLMETTKFPSTKAKFRYGTDLIFGENFPFTVKFENIGEGTANNVTASINIPSNLTIVSGRNKITIDTLDPSTDSEAEFILMCPIGEGKVEVLVEIPVSVEYTDILGNKNSLALGMAIFPIRSEKKGEKLMTQLKKLNDELTSSISPIETARDTEVQGIKNGLTTILGSIVTSTEKKINEGEFRTAEAGIEQLVNIQTFFDSLIEFLKGYKRNSDQLYTDLTQARKETGNIRDAIKQINEKLSQP
ncbi:MAG: hypothetical protein ACXAAT_08360 [Candidatus Hodarchaeales archaeon]|jgi:uncharacterized repeat protein (TIGR01451 family)